MADDDPKGSLGTDLAPSCDRCGKPFSGAGGLTGLQSMEAVCMDCLTDDERANPSSTRDVDDDQQDS
jgi:hypothetical protein